MSPFLLPSSPPYAAPGRQTIHCATTFRRPTQLPLQSGGRDAPRPLLSSAFPRPFSAPAEQQPSKPTRLASQQYCGSGAVVGSSPDRSAIVVIPMRCKSWDCRLCGPPKRQEWIRKFKHADPEREITLTIPKGKWPDPKDAAWHMVKAFVILVRRIRSTFGPFEYGRVIELTKAGTPHFHILCRGKYIPQKWLRFQWVNLGMGSIVHIQTVKDKGLHAAHLCKYLAKSTGQTAAALASMRIVQCSRKFLKPDLESTAPDQYPDFKWVFSPLAVKDILAPFLESPRYLDVEYHNDGSAHIFLDPDPPPADVLDTPEIWVAHPSLLQGVTSHLRTMQGSRALLDAPLPSCNAVPYVPFDLRKSRAPAARDLIPW
ncbi:hypothetical protein ES705_43388 [subsurface metagenome]